MIRLSHIIFVQWLRSATTHPPFMLTKTPSFAVGHDLEMLELGHVCFYKKAEYQI